MPNLETNKDKNGKNAIIDFCHSSENSSSNRNLSEADNTNNKIFSNDENPEELIFASEKAK